MILNLNQIAQIAVPVADPDRSEAFYRDTLDCGSSTGSAICVSSTVPGSVCFSTK